MPSGATHDVTRPGEELVDVLATQTDSGIRTVRRITVR